MIFKLDFKDKMEYVQAKGWFALIEGYTKEFGEDEFKKVKFITPISDEEAKKIIIKNIDESTVEECPDFTLYDIVVGFEFLVVSSTNWDI